MRAKHFGSAGVAAGHQRRARRGADGLRDVEVLKAAPLAREPLYVGRGIRRIAERVKVAIPGIVQENDDEIRLLLSSKLLTQLPPL